MRRFSKAFLSTVCATASLIYCSAMSQAAPTPVQLTLTTDSSIELTTFFFRGDPVNEITSTATAALSGTLDVELFQNDGSPPASGIGITDGTIAFEDIGTQLSIDLVIFGEIELDASGLGFSDISTNAPPFIPISSDFFDPAAGSPTSWSLNTGSISHTTTGTFGALYTDGTIDFASDPVAIDFPGLASFDQSETLVGISGGISTYDVDVLVSIPISFDETLPLDTSIGPPPPNEWTGTGVIVATGSYTYVVPEPSGIVLILLAALGFFAFLRGRSV